ncbi:hypothetical protein DYB36_014001, partial [Aphanomyces astaci]
HIECTLLNNDVAKPLHGFEALDRDDVDRVQAYMVTNSKLGVEDERVALGDEAFIKRDILPAGTPSPHLTASLLPYQQEGLAWYKMKAQEASKYRGGILADEMGMGKTIQAIATMLENVKIKQFHGMVMGGGTLIICPVIACMQGKPTKAAARAKAKTTLSDQDSSKEEEEEEDDAPIKPPPRKTNRRAKKGRSPLHEVR